MIHRVLAALLLAIVPLRHAAAAEPEHFRYQAAIEIPDDGSGAYVFELPPEAAVEIAADANMRIFDAEDKAVPFLFAYLREKSIRSSEALPVFNQGSEPGRHQNFEFELPPRQDLVNQVELLVEEDNFERTAVLLAKEKPSGSYQLIEDSLRIVRITSPEDGIRYSHTILRFPPQSKRYFKVQLGLEEGQKPLKVNSVRVLQKYDIKSRRQEITLESREPSEQESKQLRQSYLFRGKDLSRHTLLVLDNPYGELPLDRFKLEVSADAFTRTAQVLLAGSRELLPLERLAGTSLFRYGVDANLIIEASGGRRSKRYLLDIAHGDDLPFDVLKVRAAFLTAEVKFLHSAGADPYVLPFRLLYGTDRNQPPSFDIAQDIRRKKIREFQKIALGASEANSAYSEDAAASSQAAEPYLLYAAIALLVLVLTGYLLRLARSAPPQP